MTTWNAVKTYDEILFETNADGQNIGKIAKITMNDIATHNAFTPGMVSEMIDAFTIARDDATIGVIIMTGAGDQAFSSGGNQKVRGNGGYVGSDGIPRLNVLDLQRLMRIIPKPIIAMVKGWSVGGGNVLQLVADLTVAADNAKFGQTGPMVGSFDAGYGSGYLARVIGHKRAKEVWFLNHFYTAESAPASVGARRNLLEIYTAACRPSSPHRTRKWHDWSAAAQSSADSQHRPFHRFAAGHIADNAD